MDDIKVFHEALERDISELTEIIKERKSQSNFESVSEKEIIKQSVVSLGEKSMPNQSLSTTGNNTPSVLPSYLQLKNTDPQAKIEVEKLIDLVFHKSLSEALNKAKKLPSFVQDAFHDALTDKLLPELKKRGIVI